MGTRASIQVQGSKVKLYQHWDGYPEGPNGVLAVIQPIITRFWSERGHEPDMFLAYLVQQLRNLHETDGPKVTGFRLFTGNEIDDVQYKYTIDSDGKVKVK